MNPLVELNWGHSLIFQSWVTSFVEIVPRSPAYRVSSPEPRSRGKHLQCMEARSVSLSVLGQPQYLYPTQCSEMLLGGDRRYCVWTREER